MQTHLHRWFGVGQSALPDSARAGAEAAAAAIGEREPKAVFVFCSVAHDLPALLAAVRAEAGPDAAVVGATTIGELGTGGMTAGGVAVAALGGDGFTVRTRVAHIRRTGQREAGAEIAAAMHGMHDDHQVLIMLADGLAASPQEVVRGAYSVIGATVPLVGGFAGDDQRFEKTYQFCDDEIHSDAVIGIALGSDAPIGVGIAHGWRRVEPPMIVTKSQGAHIFKLDDQPALDMLLHRNNFTGTAAQFFAREQALQPLGLARRSGEDIRVLHAGDDDERSVWGTADVPQGALVWMMEADRQALIDGAVASCKDAMAHLDGLTPLGVLAFDCAGRRAGLADGGVLEEVAAIRTALDDAPFAGFYTTGEIARVRGALGMHHLTMVTLALA